MIDFIYSTVGFLIVIGILVTIHEYGHFWVARKVGVKVHRFSIGFGKVVKSWRREGDPTEYALSAIPLGGYVKMLDERVEEVAEEERHMAFNTKPLWARSAVAVAGPAANYLFAVLAMWFLVSWGMNDVPAVVGEVSDDSIAEQAGFKTGDRLLEIDGRPVRAWQQHQLYIVHQAFKRNQVEIKVQPADVGGTPVVRRIDFSKMRNTDIDQRIISTGIGLWPQPPIASISEVVKGKPADLAGMQAGDIIHSVDGDVVSNWGELVEAIMSRPGQDVALEIERDGQKQIIPLTTERAEHDGKPIGRIGVHPGRVDFTYHLGVWEGFKYALDYTWRFSAVSLRSLGKMVTQEIGSENLSGPLTIAQYAGKTAQYGVNEFVSFLVVISISLGLINLMPLPLLDGGHLLYYAIEAIKGSPVTERTMELGQQFSIVVLVLMMSLAFYNDIIRIFT